MPRDEAALLDIKHSAQSVMAFTQGMDKAAFLSDQKTQSAVLHQLLVLGEAVKRLSPDFRARHGDIPWSLMAGMRDQLIHEYDIVDLDEVWNTIEVDIPDLLSHLKLLLPAADE